MQSASDWLPRGWKSTYRRPFSDYFLKRTFLKKITTLLRVPTYLVAPRFSPRSSALAPPSSPLLSPFIKSWRCGFIHDTRESCGWRHRRLRTSLHWRRSSLWRWRHLTFITGERQHGIIMLLFMLLSTITTRLLSILPSAAEDRSHLNSICTGFTCLGFHRDR